MMFPRYRHTAIFSLRDMNHAHLTFHRIIALTERLAQVFPTEL